MNHIPERVAAWFAAPNFAHIASIEPDGTPQLSVVWVESDGDTVIFSTTKQRRKYANLRRCPRATILVSKPGDPYGYCEIRGTVTMRDDPAGELIQRLSRAYTGNPFTLDTAQTRRVVVTVTPRRVIVRG
ncbi:PPOX class F420-dependent oxidoreductase [Nocardia sp. CDC159]|uniref:PPOX class F420-dependent oxidoreductase n=1 Tax=Nocardia pulmonis TaxID=2951408 RepID=A0A9X2EAH7_9NOCA|nr:MULTISPECIES: PPOX class F420-dependent oxidoreductase [Nocardia]MCM6775890.1 PPOX class F420-dependent oxidoreductase [Nocardia pulmonis]MCM6788134.1 PPOX class F420-dependent oxidoreductase [Nocardia sp. CDC159]